ncbi:hypothetical protein [Methylobacterium nigriterrae]|uniref:hypothetical protein n=1 Tax=Methylobacterium nigriterrae TaxID=3127512 RepID=UPI0030135F0F
MRVSFVRGQAALLAEAADVVEESRCILLAALELIEIRMHLRIAVAADVGRVAAPGDVSLIGRVRAQVRPERGIADGGELSGIGEVELRGDVEGRDHAAHPLRDHVGCGVGEADGAVALAHRDIGRARRDPVAARQCMGA